MEKRNLEIGGSQRAEDVFQMASFPLAQGFYRSDGETGLEARSDSLAEMDRRLRGIYLNRR